MKKTFEEIIAFVEQANIYNESIKDKQTKLSHAIKKVNGKVKEHFEQYNEEIGDIRIDNAAADSDGVLITTEKGAFRFTKDGLKAKNKADKKLAAEWDKKSFEVEAYIATDIPLDLSEDMRTAFSGFVIK